MAALEAVQVHRPAALKLAQSELADCSAAHCARLSELSLLAGYLLLAEGRPNEAAWQLLSHPAPKDLEAFHAYYLAQARFYAGDKQAAASDFGRSAGAGTGWLRSRARARQGEALLAAGLAHDALDLLEVAAKEADTPELYYQRAIARAQSGNLLGARSDFKLIAVRFPVHPCASLALSQAAATGGAIQFTLEERLARARSFVESGQPSLALEELTAAERQKLVIGAAAKARLALGRASALFAVGRDRDAEAQLKRAARIYPGFAQETLLLRARRALHANENELARRYMGEIERRYPKEASAEEAGFFIGWIDLQAGRWEAAVRAFEAFEKRHPHSRRRDEAIWFQSLALILQRQYPQSRRALHALLRQFPVSPLVPQAQYWRARSLQLSGGDIDELAEEYQQIIRLFPGSFYSVLADTRLREVGRERPVAFPAPPRALNDPPPAELALAQSLSRAGLARDAGAEADYRIASVRDTSEAMQLGHALQRMGDYGRAYALAARALWGSAYGRKEGEALALMYPRAYQPSVERLAAEQGIDPYLIWAVMRRESSFRADVTSAANARGLMQVFPPTAVEISKRLSVNAPDPDELFSADLNVRFAAWYLAQLSARFGHLALCAAAYNAGPGPVSRWLSERGNLPLDLFVERIPYKETRAYVKQVVADYFTYRQLYGAGQLEPELDLTLPSQVKAGINF
jgi:soluble lytic murein transglycosylase